METNDRPQSQTEQGNTNAATEPPAMSAALSLAHQSSSNSLQVSFPGYDGSNEQQDALREEHRGHLQQGGSILINNEYFIFKAMHEPSMQATQSPGWTTNITTVQASDVIQVERFDWDSTGQPLMKVDYAIVLLTGPPSLQVMYTESNDEMAQKLLRHGSILSSYVQFASMDSGGAFVRRPECFQQIVIHWYSTDGVPPPDEKGSYILAEAGAVSVQPGSRFRKIGCLARLSDTANLRLAFLEAERMKYEGLQSVITKAREQMSEEE